MLLRKLLLVLVGASVALGLNGNPQDTLIDHANRISLLESNQSLVEGKFKLKSDELDLKVKQMKDDLEDDYSYLKWISIIFGSTTLIAIIILIINFKKKVNEIFEKKISETLIDKRGKLIELIHSQDEEQKILQSKNILVICANKAANRFLLNFFSRMGFSKVMFSGEDELESINNNIDLVFFDFTTIKGDAKFANNIIEKSPKQAVFFIYSDKPIQLTERDRIAFANAKAQIYGNLINCLKYQNLFMENE